MNEVRIFFWTLNAFLNLKGSNIGVSHGGQLGIHSSALIGFKLVIIYIKPLNKPPKHNLTLKKSILYNFVYQYSTSVLYSENGADVQLLSEP